MMLIDDNGDAEEAEVGDARESTWRFAISVLFRSRCGINHPRHRCRREIEGCSEDSFREISQYEFARPF